MSPAANADQRPVLIAYDGSRQAKDAIAEAGRVLGGARRAVVLIVREPIESFEFAGLGGGTTLDPATVSAMQDSAQNEATAVAEDGAALARQAGFDAEARVEIGPSPWQEIVAVADELDADLIAIGSRGRTGLSKVLLGSVASAVAQHSRRSVLIVHPETAGGIDED
ncbi:MAG TPA: universal stress protein [Solirubrobacterales bacterium]|jgi:nucleotide-binding universal stress UspA family protein|nr:universal stress protein [Solirubrobacterales bacterium]